MIGSYTRGEVVWLLSLTREQAIDMDATQRDSCAGLADDTDLLGGTGEPSQLPTIARWHDVQRAKREVVRAKEGLASLQLRAHGYSERELAKLFNRDRLALRRRWHASIEEIIERLGGVGFEEPALSHIDLCLHCGKQPRAYLGAVTIKVKGGRRTVQAARYASVCSSCLSPELSGRIIQKVASAA